MTIFVLLAIMIVAVILFLFYPNIKKLFTQPTPSEIIPKACIEQAVREAVNLTMSHGGKIKPELFFRYNNQTLAYICYTSEWYQTCVMQTPLLKQSVEKESQAYSQQKINACFNTMESNFKNQGYNLVLSGSKTAQIILEPRKIAVKFDVSAQIERNGNKEILSSDRFNTEFDSSSYDLIMIASSIQNYEARYGDSIIDTYMTYYPNIKVEKYKQSDGTKVYILTDRDTKEKLQFATRSLAWPPGFAAPGSL